MWPTRCSTKSLSAPRAIRCSSRKSCPPAVAAAGEAGKTTAWFRPNASGRWPYGTGAGVVLGRIDKLSEELRRTLQYASVIGKEFNPEMLAHITKTPVRESASHWTTWSTSRGCLLQGDREQARLQFHSHHHPGGGVQAHCSRGRRQELTANVAQTYERDYRDNWSRGSRTWPTITTTASTKTRRSTTCTGPGTKARGLYANAEAIEFTKRVRRWTRSRNRPRKNQLETAELLFSREGH